MSCPCVNIHRLHCQLGDVCNQGQTVRVIETVSMPVSEELKKEFEDIDESYITMFHGTAIENVSSIIANGFDSDKCVEPSMGKGTYLTSCIVMAAAMSSDKVVLACKVKLGHVKIFSYSSEESKPSSDYTRESQYDSACLISAEIGMTGPVYSVTKDLDTQQRCEIRGYEYVVYDSRRVIPHILIRAQLAH
jgi:hypothetical protein